MCQRASNRSFALVRDEQAGVEFWEVWDERLPFGSYGYKIIALFHDFWFSAGGDGGWNGPFHSREQICARQRNHYASAELCATRQQGGLCAFGEEVLRSQT